MRVVALLLLFAAAFGLAGLWQSQRLRALERERELALRIQDGEIGRTPSGPLERGQAVVVVGSPSGVEPAAIAGDPVAEAESEAAIEPVVELAPPPLPDFTLSVQAGQTLSEIARAHYGSASRELVARLAAYNGLRDADALEQGAVLALPPVDKLVR